MFSTVKKRWQWHPTPVLLPGKSHGQGSLVGCSPWGGKESGMTERLHFHFSLSCIGEGNGNPLQCSCLENPRDGGAWWAVTPGMGSHRVGHDWSDSSSNSIVKKWLLSKIDFSHSNTWIPEEIDENYWNKSNFLKMILRANSKGRNIYTRKSIILIIIIYLIYVNSLNNLVEKL